MNELFRPEAVAAHQAPGLGCVRLARPLAFSVWVAAAMICVVALMSFAIGGEVTRKARIAGILAPAGGSVQLQSPAAGVVRLSSAQEGDLVEAGQSLFSVEGDRSIGSGEVAGLTRVSLDSRRASLTAERDQREAAAIARDQALKDRRQSLEVELVHADEESALVQRRIQLADQSLRRWRQLAGDGFAADAQVQQKLDDRLEHQGRAVAIARARGGLARDLRAIAHDEVQARAARLAEFSQITRALAELDQALAENQARQQLWVRAPQRGVISALHVSEGQTVQPGQPLLTLLPPPDEHASELRAQLFAPSRTAGFVREGQRVWMRYAAYPHQKFGMHGGRIASVSHAPINPQELPAGHASPLMAAAGAHEPLYRIDVALDAQSLMAYGEAHPLRPGTVVEGDIIQDRRAVWEWLFDPLLAGAGRWRLSARAPQPAQGVPP